MANVIDLPPISPAMFSNATGPLNTIPDDESSIPDDEIVLDLPVPDMDGKAPCSKCGRSFKVKADGTIRQHKCIPGSGPTNGNGATTVRRSTAATVRRPKGKAPDTVRRMGVALIGAGVESGAAFTVSRYVPMERASIPEEVVTLPDADAMIGPFIDRLWPELPKGTQALLKRLSEMEDLITAMFLWSQWTRTVGQYASEAREYRLTLEAQNQKSTTQPTPYPHLVNGDTTNGEVHGTSEQQFVVPVPGGAYPTGA